VNAYVELCRKRRRPRLHSTSAASATNPEQPGAEENEPSHRRRHLGGHLAALFDRRRRPPGATRDQDRGASEDDVRGGGDVRRSAQAEALEKERAGEQHAGDRSPRVDEVEDAGAAADVVPAGPRAHEDRERSRP
jgi:hypothetical protein